MFTKDGGKIAYDVEKVVHSDAAWAVIEILYCLYKFGATSLYILKLPVGMEKNIPFLVSALGYYISQTNLDFSILIWSTQGQRVSNMQMHYLW